MTCFLKKKTGRGFNDFVKVNKNYDEISDEQLLKEYYSLTESDLDNEDSLDGFDLAEFEPR